MNKILKDLFNVLQTSEKKIIIYLQFIFIFGAIIEFLSVFSILPYIYVLSTDIEIFELLDQYNLTFLEKIVLNNYDPKIFVGLILFILILFSNLIQFSTNFIIIKFSNYLGKKFQLNLFNKYINMKYSFFEHHQNSDLKQNIIQEGSRIVPGVIMPILNINSKLFNILIISSVLVIQFSIGVFIVLALMIFYYLVIYKYFQKKSSESGLIISTSAKKYLKYMDFAFNNFLLTKINFLEKYFFRNIKNYISQHIQAVNFLQIISTLPKYIIETLMFGGLIIISIYFYYIETDNLIPKLSFLAFAAYRLVPSFNMVYNNYVILNSNKIALKIYKQSMSLKSENNVRKKNLLNIDSINIQNLSFSYGKQKILDNVSFNIKKGQTIGITGPSGSGKSTLFRILIGLEKNFKGEIKINSNLINPTLYKHAQLGIVYQDPKTFDDDLIYNIISNSYLNQDDLDILIRSLELDSSINRQLHSLIINEDGSNLSGGQIRRIMLAHALYKKPKILFLDETFSSLDSNLEKKIIGNIKKNYKDLIVFIISHNKSTLNKCDKVVKLK